MGRLTARPADAGRRFWVWYGLSVWLVFAVTATGTLPNDPNARFQLAEAVLRTGRVELPDNIDATVVSASRRYCVFFPGQSVVFLPTAAWSVWGGRLPGMNATLSGLSARFVAGVIWMPLFGVAAVLGFAACLRLLGLTRGAAAAAGVGLAFATPFWVYATTASEEMVLAAAGVWSLWAVLDARRLIDDATADTRRVADRLGLAAVLWAVGLTHRATFGVVVIGVVIVAVPVVLAGRRAIFVRWKRLAGWLAVAALLAATVPAYNWLRFGDVFETGYARFYVPFGGVYATPLWTGLAGHLISPGKSVFLYSPLLLLMPLAMTDCTVRRRTLPLWAGGAVMTVLHFWLYSRHTFWSGEHCWGVRFHTSLLPLWLLPIAVWGSRHWQGAVRWPLAGLVAIAVLVQVAGLSFGWGLEHFQHPEYFTGSTEQVPTDAAWTWKGCQLRMRVVNIVAHLRGETLLHRDQAATNAVFNAWAFFPARAGAMIQSRGVVGAVWGVWFVLAAALAVAAGRTLKLHRRAASFEVETNENDGGP